MYSTLDYINITFKLFINKGTHLFNDKKPFLIMYLSSKYYLRALMIFPFVFPVDLNLLFFSTSLNLVLISNSFTSVAVLLKVPFLFPCILGLCHGILPSLLPPTPVTPMQNTQ